MVLPARTYFFACLSVRTVSLYLFYIRVPCIHIYYTSCAIIEDDIFWAGLSADIHILV
jgi:hypothetical protein